ncbi:MAG: peptidylprolyl isomerase [Clostridiales bacterium]|nr:peptidylprolyl isomerase [Clostridiales bacterium]
MADGQVMRLELYPACAPNTVANFVNLCESGFYNGLTFHRVVLGYMIQGGDPNGDGTGDAGYTIAGEFAENGFDNPLLHERGVISMARYESDVNSASSQFFIMQYSYQHLDGRFAAFGRIVDEESLAVLDSIATTAVDAYYAPLFDQTIASITVDTHGYQYTVTKMEEE